MSSTRLKPDLSQIGRDAVGDVLETLLSQAVTFGSPTGSAPADQAPDAITSTVHFEGPQVSGTVRMHLPVAFAVKVACVLIGLDDAASDAQDVVDDTAGELGNMVAGRVAAQLATQGFPCVLGIPLVVRGPWLPLEFSSIGGEADRARLEAFCVGHPLSLEIQCHSLLP